MTTSTPIPLRSSTSSYYIYNQFNILYPPENTSSTSPVKNQYNYQPFIEEYIVTKNIPRKKIDLQNQPVDREKERSCILEKNRIAAIKCRERKKLWIEELTKTYEERLKKNRILRRKLFELDQEVQQLKNQLTIHSKCKCRLLKYYMKQQQQKHQQQQQKHHQQQQQQQQQQQHYHLFI